MNRRGFFAAIAGLLFGIIFPSGAHRWPRFVYSRFKLPADFGTIRIPEERVTGSAEPKWYVVQWHDDLQLTLSPNLRPRAST
jgi:hypothetical protein